LQVFIDDVVGSIAVTDQLRAGVYPMVGGNCSVAREQAEIGQAARMDRMCLRAYGSQEDPAVGDTTNGWDEAQFERWLHVLSYRDLYQQKLAYVRGYLGASGADRLQDYDYRATTGSLGFLIPTTDAGQYYDEGANGRCAAYDPFNKMQLVANVGDAYRYTIQSLEYGRCGSCSSAEKEFLTGPELTVQGKVVCTLNDWNKVKLYCTREASSYVSEHACPRTCRTRCFATPLVHSQTCRASRDCSSCITVRSRARNASTLHAM
jgi:hypothetical protein